MHNDMGEFAEARRLSEPAAEKGHPEAQHTLGSMHYHGDGGRPNLGKARRFLALAAAQGHADAQACGQPSPSPSPSHPHPLTSPSPSPSPSPQA
eukprot:scaffold31841_cov40-Phaeocystis_antarctica.AAC.3